MKRKYNNHIQGPVLYEPEPVAVEEEWVTVKYPDICVKILGEGLSDWETIAKVRNALKDHGAPYNEITQYLLDATFEGHDHMIDITLQWVMLE